MSWSVLEQCVENCHHGTCIEQNATSVVGEQREMCICDAGWWGADCSVQYCLGGNVSALLFHWPLSHCFLDRFFLRLKAA